MRRIIVLVFFLLTAPLAAQWTPWQVKTPRQTLSVPSDGSVITFNGVSLPSGMTYRIVANGSIKYNTGGDDADACFFNNLFLHISPDLGGKLGLKVRTSPTAEDWFYYLAGQPNYNSGHSYSADIISTSNPLSVRYFDTDEPAAKPQNYGDNSGSFTVEVAQETPRVAVEQDTLFFIGVPIGIGRRRVDSIQSYGVQGYRVDNVTITGPSLAKFTVSSQRPTPFTITETTNEFEFVYTPTVAGGDTAYFHFYSSNAYGPDQHKIITLIGNGIGAQLSVKPDTLHFGTIAVAASKTLTEKIHNTGSISTNITSIVMAPLNAPFTFTPSATSVNARDSVSIDVTFNPVLLGTYLASFTCAVEDGSTLTFYATATAGQAVARLSDSVLDFGLVILGQSKVLTDTIRNTGNSILTITNTLNTNPTEYLITGKQGPNFYTPGSGEVYTITFKPATHLPGWQNHDGSFTFYFDDGTSKTITFKGADHLPLTVRLAIDSNYYTNPGKTIDVYQRMLDPLDSTVLPVRSLSERITYDANLLEFIRVEKGPIISSADWKLTSTPGAGFIDISLAATTDRLGPAGKLLRIVFKVRESAIDTTTPLFQSNVNFFNSIEPFATTSAGRIIIKNQCTPIVTNNAVSKVSGIDQNHPNPFSQTTELVFSVGASTDGNAVPVRLYLMDNMGRLVKELVHESKTPGYYKISIDGSSLPQGVYKTILEAGSYRGERTVVVVK